VANFLDYFSFERSFTASLAKLKLPADCTRREPTWEVTNPPHCWTVEVFFDFKDQKHIRIWDSFGKIAGLQMSRRLQWSYHYGATEVVDELGNAVRGAPDDPLDLRIDTSGGRVHLHHRTQEPHYYQDKIVGLSLVKVESLDFVKAVFKQRKSGEPFPKILGFKIT
jgi:hypothetical protein